MRDAQLTLLDDGPPAPSMPTNGESVIRFTIVGRPQQAGSKRAFWRDGKAVVTDANRKAKPWMQAVRLAAAGVLPDGFELLRGAIAIFWAKAAIEATCQVCQRPFTCIVG